MVVPPPADNTHAFGSHAGIATMYMDNEVLGELTESIQYVDSRDGVSSGLLMFHTPPGMYSTLIIHFF